MKSNNGTNTMTSTAPEREMLLTGVGVYGVELANLLAALLLQHGHIEESPADLHELLAAARGAVGPIAPRMAVVQEGGASVEAYLHLYDTPANAERLRVVCVRDGSYRTSEVIEVPGTLGIHPDFATVVQKIVVASLNFDYAQDGPADIAAEDLLRINVRTTGEDSVRSNEHKGRNRGREDGIFAVRFNETAASQPLATRASIAIDILIAEHDFDLEDSAFDVHVVDAQGNSVQTDPEHEIGTCGDDGELELVDDVPLSLPAMTAVRSTRAI